MSSKFYNVKFTRHITNTTRYMASTHARALMTRPRLAPPPRPSLRAHRRAAHQTERKEQQRRRGEEHVHVRQEALQIGEARSPTTATTATLVTPTSASASPRARPVGGEPRGVGGEARNIGAVPRAREVGGAKAEAVAHQRVDLRHG